MNPTDLAWVAGFFDGEGCIRAREYHRTDTKHPRTCWCIIMSVTQRDRTALLHFQKIVGFGTVTAKTGMTAWQWVSGSPTSIANLINLILQYSVVKHEQLLVALELISRLKQRKGRGFRISEEERNERHRLTLLLSQLKHPALFPDSDVTLIHSGS